MWTLRRIVPAGKTVLPYLEVRTDDPGQEVAVAAPEREVLLDHGVVVPAVELDLASFEGWLVRKGGHGYGDEGEGSREVGGEMLLLFGFITSMRNSCGG